MHYFRTNKYDALTFYYDFNIMLGFGIIYLILLYYKYVVDADAFHLGVADNLVKNVLTRYLLE